MSTKVLQDAILERSRLYAEALERLQRLASPESEDEVYTLTSLLCEAVEVVKCARRLVDGRTPSEIHAAFGAPGDFGYEHPIGAALYAVYSAKSVTT